MTSTTNVGGTQVYRGQEREFSQALDLQSEIQTLKESLNDPNVSQADKDAIRSLLERATDATDNSLDTTTNSKKFDTNNGSKVGDNDRAFAIEQNQLAEDLIAEVKGLIAAPPSQPIDPPPASGGVSGAGGASGASAAGGASGADGAAAAGTDANGSAVSGGDDARVAAMMKDPGNAYKQLEGIKDPAKRAELMQSMQVQLQMMNQMFSMMSNFAKVSHDTAKAMINNMRV